MTITVRFFAILKEQAGASQTALEIPADSSVEFALGALIEKFPQLERSLKRSATAVNRDYAQPKTILHDGDELALIPPVSGG